MSESVCSMNKKRKRGTGSISRRPNGTLEASFKCTHIGSFKSRQEAELALEKCIKSGKAIKNIKTRPRGTGSICQKQGSYQAILNSKYVGSFKSRQEAELALKQCIKNGKVIKNLTNRPSGTGTIYQSRGKYTAAFKCKHVGSFKTRQEAELALEQCIKSGKVIKNIKTRPRGTGTIYQSRGKYKAEFKCKYVGSFKTRQEAELALEQCIKSGNVVRIGAVKTRQEEQLTKKQKQAVSEKIRVYHL